MSIPENTRHDEMLESSLLQGLDSGDPIEIDDEWWSRKRAELTARFAEKRDPNP